MHSAELCVNDEKKGEPGHARGGLSATEIRNYDVAPHRAAKLSYEICNLSIPYGVTYCSAVHDSDPYEYLVAASSLVHV